MNAPAFAFLRATRSAAVALHDKILNWYNRRGKGLDLIVSIPILEHRPQQAVRRQLVDLGLMRGCVSELPQFMHGLSYCE